jgi:hypothetical protein
MTPAQTAGISEALSRNPAGAFRGPAGARNGGKSLPGAGALQLDESLSPVFSNNQRADGMICSMMMLQAVWD